MRVILNLYPATMRKSMAGIEKVIFPDSSWVSKPEIRHPAERLTL